MTICLLLLESGVRLLLPQRSLAVSVNAWDPHWGVRQIPMAKGFVNTPEYHMDLRISSQGLRDRVFPYKKPPGTRRILCLGDSYTCGYGVAAEETFAKRLERRLNGQAAGSRRYEVINAGVGSTGTAHQLAYFVDEGHRFEPDVVVLCFCAANDFWDNGVAGLYRQESGRLIRSPVPATWQRRVQWLIGKLGLNTPIVARSHLANLVRIRLGRLHFRLMAARAEGGGTVEEILDRRDTLTAALVEGLRDACAEHAAALMVMFVPRPDDPDLIQRTQQLLTALEGDGIDCLDLTPAFARREAAGEVLVYPVDGHWNARGHDAAADTLRDFLDTAAGARDRLAPRDRGPGIAAGRDGPRAS